MKYFHLLLGLAVTLVTTSAQPLSVATRSMHAPEMGTLRYLELRFGGETFSVVPPGEWRMQSDAALGRLELAASTGAVAITFQFTTNAPREALASNAALLRAVPNLAQPRLLGEFTPHGNNTAGRGVDVAFKQNDREMRGRVAGLPLGQGTLFVVLTSSAAEFNAAASQADAMLNSFQRVRDTTGK